MQELISIIKNWINDELGDEKIRMKVSLRKPALVAEPDWLCAEL